MEQRRIFRSSLGGFNKEDVNRYIAELSKRIDEVNLLRGQAETQLDDLRARQEEILGENGRLKEELADSSSRLTTLQAGNDLLLEKVRQHFDEKAKSIRETATLKEKIAELDQRIPELQERAQRYEQDSLHIAHTLVSAREEADRILSGARDMAELVHKRLRGELDTAAGAVQRMLLSYGGIREGLGDLCNSMTSTMDGLLQELNGTQERLEDILLQEDLGDPRA